MIVWCQATNRMEQTKQQIEDIIRNGDKFDRKVLIINEHDEDFETLSDEDKKWLYDHNCEYYTRTWNDDMPGMRNAYLDKVQTDDWVIVSDSDEFFCDEFLKDIRMITEQLDDQGYKLALINSHDVTYQEKRGDTQPNKSSFYKNLIFKKGENTRYVGVGNEQKVHETLQLGYETKVINLPDEYFYIHEKFQHEVWERAARNVFIGGGGNNVGKLNEEWVKLRELTAMLNIDTWQRFRKFIIQSYNKDVGISNIEEWIFRNTQKGFDYQNEMCDIFLWYRYLHPERCTGIEISPISNKTAEIMAEVEKTYLEVLGRHADDIGKTTYTKLIEQNRMTIDGVKQSLINSLEYKGKHQQEDIEKIDLGKLKFDVTMEITERQIIDQIIKKSKIYRDVLLPAIQIGKKWEAMMSITKKEETNGEGMDISQEDQFQPIVSMFQELCPVTEYNTILDIGAGAGIETNLLRKLGYNPIGITYGQDNINYAKTMFNIDLKEMDMHNLEFPPGLFDAIISIQTFEHAFSAWLHILEMRKVLRVGGRIFIDVPDPNDEAMLGTIWHTNVLYPNQIKSLFKKAGFKEVRDLSVKHRLAFCFQKLSDTDPEWKDMWGYVKHIMNKLYKVN